MIYQYDVGLTHRLVVTGPITADYSITIAVDPELYELFSFRASTIEETTLRPHIQQALRDALERSPFPHE